MKKIILTICIALIAVAGAQAQDGKKSKKDKDKSEMNAQDVYKQFSTLHCFSVVIAHCKVNIF